jgi:hypothetical protein
VHHHVKHVRRNNYDHGSDDGVQEIGWDEFFAILDREGMVLVYQNQTESGKLSRFGRIVRREAVAQAVIE